MRLVDLTPLRSSRDFRLLFAAGAATYLGGMMTYVAVPFQLYRLTGSNLAVGAMGLVELLPLVLCGLYGGALADHYERRRILLLTAAAQLVLTLGLLANTLAGARVWALYALGGLLSAVQALQTPSWEALIPRVVRHDQLPAAVALSTLAAQAGMLAGPALGGLLMAGPGAQWCYSIDAAGVAVSAVLFVGLGHHPPSPDSDTPSLAGILDGLRYAARRRDLLGTYVVDLAAMITAMPVTLFPAFAGTVLHRPDLLGVFYTAETVGSLIATATSGWVGRVHRHGRAIVLAAAAWGLAVAAAGAAPGVWWALGFLVLAGAADMVSGLFRGIVWNQTIPDDRRGRLAGVEMLSYSIGPLGGQLRAGLIADATSVRASIVSGGLACAGAVAVTAGLLRSLWKYDARTDVHATTERARRAAAASPNPSPSPNPPR
jgi:MFS family permease